MKIIHFKNTHTHTHNVVLYFWTHLETDENNDKMYEHSDFQQTHKQWPP